MVNINGLNGFGSLGGPDKPENKAQTPANNQPVFNPNAQVMPAQSQAAAMARLQFKKSKSSSAIDGEMEEFENSEIEVDVETIGLIKISDEQLERFKERVEKGLKDQEEQIMSAVNMFGGNEQDLRHVISSIMLF